MKNILEINDFLRRFNCDSYNKVQIGYDKKNIIRIYEFLKKLNLEEELIAFLIDNIAYFKDNDINLPLYLELLSRTLGFIDNYELEEVIKIVKEIHDIYAENSNELSLEEYLHDTEESRLKKIFLDRNNKYIIKVFNNIDQYINELKFAAAVTLDKKEYKEFLSYIDDFTSNRDHYSPLIIFKTYSKLRSHLKGITKLFWDIYYGNEYIVAFNKHNLKISAIYDQNALLEKAIKKEESEPIQLDLFTYQDYQELEVKLSMNLKLFQISSLYSKVNLPESNSEKDLLAYYSNFLNSREIINLPKLKEERRPKYSFEIN